jgi:uncharacterized membrane protein YcaP (DUF421 family)
MDTVLRGLGIYLVLLVVFRVAGRRTLAQATTFELVVLLIISETTQNAMIGDDHSVTNAVLLIGTLVGASILLAALKLRFPRLDRLLEGRPVLLVEDGRLQRDRMRAVRVEEEDILAAARRLHGLTRMDQVRHAVLEVEGQISIIPAGPGGAAQPPRGGDG